MPSSSSNLLPETPQDALPLLPELIEHLPNLAGWEAYLPSTKRLPITRSSQPWDMQQIKGVFAIALHMHQPIVPAGENGELISYLQYMFEHPFEGNNFNAGAFTYCYTRIADFLIAITQQGGNPRILLDYSGTLLWGLCHMGRGEILENLKRITCDSAYYFSVEWMGTLWSHALVPSIPVADFKLQVQAWQHHFAAIFGWDALDRVQGFSLPDLELPTHPDVLYEWVSVLLSCGYRWMIVAESSVETLTGAPIQSPHIPHQLMARNREGAIASIPVFIRPSNQTPTDVARLSAYSQAQALGDRPCINGISLPPIVMHIGDGENGEAMMNEFPSAFRNTWYDVSNQNQGVVSMTPSEYLESLEKLGCSIRDLPTCQAVGQAQVWSVLSSLTTSELTGAIATAVTGNLGSKIYPPQAANSHPRLMSKLSTLFHATIARASSDPGTMPLQQQYRYRNALLHHLLFQTSCFMRWPEDTWHTYARELHRRTEAILRHDF